MCFWSLVADARLFDQSYEDLIGPFPDPRNEGERGPGIPQLCAPRVRMHRASWGIPSGSPRAGLISVGLLVIWWYTLRLLLMGSGPDLGS